MTVSDSTAALDRQLVATGDRVRRMGSVLVDLEDDPARVLLPTAPLIGATALAWAETDARLQVVWQLYPLVRDAIDELTARRGTRPDIGLTERNTISAALNGPSVAIDPDLARSIRDATAGAVDLPGRCSLDQLAAAFEAVLEPAVSTLDRVGQVWDQVLPALVECGRMLDEADAAGAGRHSSNEIAATRRLIDDLRSRAAADPLELDLGQLDHVRSSTVLVCQAVADAAELERTFPEKVDTVAVRFDVLAARLEQCQRTREQAAERILGAEHLRAPLEEITQIGRLRADVDALHPMAPDEWVMAARQLDRLMQACDRLDARVGQLENEAMAGLALRNELRGRLDAYRAKAAAIGRAEDIDLDRLQQAAADVLWIAPCDLAEAARRVEDYQHAVNQPTYPEDRR